LNPTDGADASTDTDGDGLTNLQEFRAGTNPRNPNSIFRISSVASSAGAINIRFPSVSGKVYRIEYSASLTSAGKHSRTTFPAQAARSKSRTILPRTNRSVFTGQ